MMTPPMAPKTSPVTPGQSMLDWLFTRGNHAMACGVHARGRQRYEVHVTALWDGDAPVCEVFDRPMDAVRRHAEIAFYLRQSGWQLVDRGALSSAA
jgi:hypothetical protein